MHLSMLRFRHIPRVRHLSTTVLDDVHNLAHTSTFAPRYGVLNSLSPQEITKFIPELTLNEDLSGNSNTNVTIADYINPLGHTLPTLLQNIQKNQFPEKLMPIVGVSLKQQFATDLVTKVIYQKYVESQIYNTKPQSSDLDLANPEQWFPQARKMKRKIIMHVGPTNLGKTYQSLQKLGKAKLGYYAGPLRLLAREIYERFNADNIPCNLITGEEVIPAMDLSGKTSEISLGTIEMIPFSKKMDMCVIDEIQMLADPHRGAAWTAAVLGVQAKEIHLCGEELAVDIIEKMCKATGDELEIKRFQRLGKLTVEKKAVSDYTALKPGDCVIAFSKRTILEIKLKIELQTKLRVGVIYGALPPEIRSQEAHGFNQGKYDVLVATDAIGMGLNLRIRRVVFFATSKFDGKEVIPLTVSQIKQIAGRAGRYLKDQGELEGFVTAITRNDLTFVTRMMKQDVKMLDEARVWPSTLAWKAYMLKFSPDTLFFEILSEFDQETDATIGGIYTIPELASRISVLKMFLRDNLYRRITIDDQLTLSLAPIQTHGDGKLKDIIHTFLQMIANNTSKNVFMCGMLQQELLSRNARPSTELDKAMLTLTKLEEMHKTVLVFLWLSQRWPHLFVDKELASEVKLLIEKRISQELDMIRRLNKVRRGGIRR